MRLVTIMTMSLASLLLLASIAVADAEYTTQRVYFECDGTTKVDNVNQRLGDDTPTWSTTAPTESVQAGAGCGAADTGFAATAGPAAVGEDATWSGTFTGNLDTIRIEGHVLANPGTQLCGGVTVRGSVTIDGTTVSFSALEATTATSSTGASASVQFAVTGIDLVDAQDGPGTVAHDISLTVGGNFVDCDNVLEWVWGTTEVPAGLEFNDDVTGLPAVAF